MLKDYQAVGEFQTRPQSAAPGETYYIMHPVLRHAAILSSRDSEGLIRPEKRVEPA